MKVMIVSFDRSLTESLKEALSEHEVYVAKNSEEALKMIPPEIEVVIYDAISGAISEEDINTLYTKKFSNARYMILYDELFPVDSNNIVATFKKFVPRDTPPSEVAQKVFELTKEVTPSEEGQGQEEAPAPPIETQETEPEQELIEHTSLAQEPSPDIEPAPQEELEIEPTQIQPVEEPTQSYSEEIEIEPTTIDIPEVEESQKPQPEFVQEVDQAPQETVEEALSTPQEPAGSGGKKVLLISFDKTLFESLRGALGNDYDILNVKTVKHALQKGKDAGIVVFDAISGVIAEKGLIDMSNDPAMKNKPYLILVDDLFPINTDSIPLEKKESISRDADPERIKELILSMFETPEAEEVQEAQAEEAPEMPTEAPEQPVADIAEEEQVEEVVETPTAQIEEALPQSEEVEEITAEGGVEDVEELVAELSGGEETTTQEVQEEEEIPALEALGKLIEEQQKEEELPTAQIEEVSTEVPPTTEIAEEPVEEITEEPSPVETQRVTTAETTPGISLSEEQIREAILSAVDQKLSELGEVIASAVREKVEETLESADIQEIIKEVAYKVLKERLEEIVS